ncbi:hypothetical protein BC835DRAFT_1336876 [Cytidiella melzeri]|nr:hypothetical protein BC835DRAFT_1336876 [Cytidiella melzeri]
MRSTSATTMTAMLLQTFLLLVSTLRTFTFRPRTFRHIGLTTDRTCSTLHLTYCILSPSISHVHCIIHPRRTHKHLVAYRTS